MPRKRKPARLWLRPAEGNRPASWIILDSGRQYRTGFLSHEGEKAERRLEEYLAEKHDPRRVEKDLHPSHVYVADVLSVYLDEVVPDLANPNKVADRLERLVDWWGQKRLSEVGRVATRAYAASRKKGGGRRDLEDLRAAINHHARCGLHSGHVDVELPKKGAARVRWLTRSEVARLLWVCWRHGRTVRLPRGEQKGTLIESGYYDLRHIARFILIGVYTGSRSGTILAASIYAGANRSLFDLDNGVFYRRADGEAETNKRQPTAPIPPRLLVHLRRWRDKGLVGRHVVEWQQDRVKSVKVGWKRAVRLAGLQGKVVPHTLRHTAATWLMQQGVDIWEAAGFLGMSEQVLRETYGHHHPNFLRNAAARIGQKRVDVK